MTKASDSSNKFTAQEYAAIHLKVPNSGTEWLDQMILRARELDTEGFRNLVSKPTTMEGSHAVYEQAMGRIKRDKATPRKGTNCGATDGVTRSKECVEEHDATVTGKTNPQGPPNPPKGGKGRKIA